jgi:anti-sigma regulatory factor (Ser/Thr protein kinase)
MAPPTTTGTSPAARAVQRTLTIRGCTREVARARAFVAQTLGPDHPGAEAAVLLTSELVTNAVLHSDSREDGTVTVAVTHLGDWLRVEVSDAGSADSTPVVKDSGCADSGHGLFLVNALAREWGCCTGEGQTTVWFSIAT